MTTGGPLVRGPLSLNSKKKKNTLQRDEILLICLSEVNLSDQITQSQHGIRVSLRLGT